MTEISIHALLAESDGAISQLQCALGNFYPRSPCGERRAYLQYLCELSLQNFYPRSPCGERRLFLLPFYTRQQFLSTLSLRRATEYWVGGYGTANNFYPRSPCGERLRRLHMADFDKIFLSTLSLRRATIWAFLSLSMICAFLSTLSLRRATRCDPLHGWSLEFLSTLSLRRATIIIHY